MQDDPNAPCRVEEEDTVSLLDYLLPLLKWRRMIFGVCLASVALGIGVAWRQAPFYTATAFFIPVGVMGEQDELRSLTGASGKRWEQGSKPSDVVKYYEVLLKTQSLMDRLLASEFDDGAGARKSLRAIMEKNAKTPSIEGKLVSALRKNIIVASGGGKLLTVSSSWGHPVLAADVVNRLLDEFVRTPQRSENASADMRLILERMEDVRKKLDDKEKEIVKSRTHSLDAGLPDTVRQESALAREAGVLDKMYVNLSLEYEKAQIRMIQIQKAASGEINVLERAGVPFNRAGPRRTRTVVMFLFAGIVVSCGLAFVVEWVRAGMGEPKHPFWDILRNARRDLILMALSFGIAVVALIIYRSLR